MDLATITAAISAASAGIRLIDKIASQLRSFLTGSSEPTVYEKHRLMFEGSGSEIVARSRGGRVVQKITAKDMERLPEEQLRHIRVLEQAMQNHYNLWAAVYPQRNASPDPLVNAKVDQQLKKIVSGMADDLNGVLSFLESCGLYLDDHYVHIRDLVSRAKDANPGAN